MPIDDYRKRIEEIARQAREEVRKTVPPGTLAPWPPEPVLRSGQEIGQPSVREWHVLAAADSDLRHSVVEACFYNLRVYAQVWGERSGDPAFYAACREMTRDLAKVKERLEGFTGSPFGGGQTLNDLFPERVRTLRSDVERLQRFWDEVLAGGMPPAEVEARVPQALDAVLGGLRRISRDIQDRKTRIVEPLERMLERGRERLEQDGVTIDLRIDPAAREAATFLDVVAWEDLLSEVFRNSFRHAFAAWERAEPKRLTISAETVPELGLFCLRICDNGPGPNQSRGSRGTGEGLHRCAERARQQCGLFRLVAAEQGGACAEVLLPLRLPQGMPLDETAWEPVIARHRASGTV